MEIRILRCGDPAWEAAAAFAESCPWRAGAYLARLMRENRFAAWERVFAAFDGGQPVGFCTLTAKDEMPQSCAFTPFIGFVFVDEAYRGNRLSERLIAAACTYAKTLGYADIYLTSDEQGLYEKYGFVKSGAVITARGEKTQLYTKGLQR